MFRTDNATDSGYGNTGGGGVTSRKAHPIFGKKSSDVNNADVNQGGGFWNLCICSINLNNSDPRLRPPICCVIVGAIVMVTGTITLVFKRYSVALTSGIVVTAIGAAILLFSFVWIFIARKKIVRALERKAAAIACRSPERILDDKSPPDPIMNRGLVGIYYKSCEDTIPPGFRRFPNGTKSVRIPPTDGFMPVESTCFQLVSVKEETKAKSTSLPYSYKLLDSEDPYSEENGVPRKRTSESSGRILPQRPSLTSEEKVKNATKLDSNFADRSSHRNSSKRAEQGETARTLQYDNKNTELSLRQSQKRFNHANVYRNDFEMKKREH